MTDYDTPPVWQDYRQLFDGPDPCQLAQRQQPHPEQPTLPSLDSVPPLPQRPAITIDTWPVEPVPDVSGLPDNAPNHTTDNVPDGAPDDVPDHNPNDEPEAEQVSGFLFLVKWSLVAALILAGFISYL